MKRTSLFGLWLALSSLSPFVAASALAGQHGGGGGHAPRGATGHAPAAQRPSRPAQPGRGAGIASNNGYANAGMNRTSGIRLSRGYGGGFGNNYNIEMQRLEEHQYELHSIGQFLPIQPAAPAITYNPNYVRRASLLDPDATFHRAPPPLSIANPFYHPSVARQSAEPIEGDSN